MKKYENASLKWYIKCNNDKEGQMSSWRFFVSLLLFNITNYIGSKIVYSIHKLISILQCFESYILVLC